MSQNWQRWRGLANPIPALEPGGQDPAEWDPAGDVVLPDDHFARLHNPANGRVPPQLPSPLMRPQFPQFPLQHYARFFRVTPAVVNEQMSFTASSVRIDNYSSHWIFVRSSGVYIPPFIYGTVLLLDPGVAVADYVLAAPQGHADSASLESLVLTIWYEAPSVPCTGYAVPTT